MTEPDHNAVFARFLDWSFKLHLLGVDRGLEPGINERRDLLAIHGSKEPAGFAHLFLHLKLRAIKFGRQLLILLELALHLFIPVCGLNFELSERRNSRLFNQILW